MYRLVILEPKKVIEMCPIEAIHILLQIAQVSAIQSVTSFSPIDTIKKKSEYKFTFFFHEN